uniref:Uncharacterized protein n=1 Tax=Salix viminalis TaxID=40686 RepID=A0A6N2KBM9_SALVM
MTPRVTPRAIKLGTLKQKRKKHGPTTPIKRNKHGSWRWTVANLSRRVIEKFLLSPGEARSTENYGLFNTPVSGRR